MYYAFDILLMSSVVQGLNQCKYTIPIDYLYNTMHSRDGQGPSITNALDYNGNNSYLLLKIQLVYMLKAKVE